MDGLDNHPKPESDGDRPQVRRTPIQHLESHLWRKIAFGFFVLAPLLITFAILAFFGLYIDDFIRPLPFVENRPYDFPGIGLVFAVVVLYLVGALASTRVGRRFVHWEGVVLSHIPLVKSIYGVVRQATDALTAPPSHRFSRVVFIEWPRAGMMAMGFVTGYCQLPEGEDALVAVYVPTVPNPTSGNLAFVSEEKIIESGLTMEEAMKVVFSGGIVLPNGMRLRSKASLSEPLAEPVED